MTVLPLLLATAMLSATQGAKLAIKREDATSGNKVVCYFPNWGQYRQGAPYLVSDIDPQLCTHLLYAFAKIVGNDLDTYEWNDLQMYQEFNELKISNPALKTMLSVGGATMGIDPFIHVSSTEENRQEFSRNVVSYLREYGFDGVDIDWEFPRAQDKYIFKKLLEALRSAFDLESQLTGNPRLLLSCALAAAEDVIMNSYDLPGIAESVDFANVMAYDLHGGWDQVTGFHSALNGYESWDVFAQKWVVDTYLSLELPADKLVLGIPAYGRSFRLCNPSNHGVRDCAAGNGDEGEYTKEAGTLAYFEICTKLSQGYRREYDTIQEVPYAYRGNQWVGYDDTQSIAIKAAYVQTETLAGVVFWDLSKDDYDNWCGEGNYPLIKAALSSPPPGEPATTSSPTTTATTTTPATTSDSVPITTATTAPPTTTGRTTATPRTTTTTTRTPRPTTTTTTTVPSTSTTTTATTTTTTAGTTTTTTTTTPDEQITCDGPFSIIRHPMDCSSYYQCSHGVPYLMHCPAQLVFDTVTKICNWPDNVQC